jgi:putative peptide zinc metalloprotease protein
MTSSLPRFRGDLTLSQQVSAAGTVFVLKDPVTERFYRLPEEAYYIARQLDGETPLEVVRRGVEEKFQTSLTARELNEFVVSLKTAGLLDNGKNGEGRSRPRRIQGSPLYLRIRFFDPDRLFNYLVGKVRWCFTPWFLMLSAVIILTAVGIAASNWEDAVRDFSRLLRYSAIPVIVTIVFLVVTLHEFAHGLTCKHFGGEVHEIGFYLIYLQPALYCNVSDAWLFPEKSKRLWVAFAGPYFELLLWALATLAWRLTDVETTINYLALIVMATSGIKTLLNFNPLIKLDGYYLLSDWLEIPNLRKKGFACFSDGIKKLFGGKAPQLEQMSLRERRICLAYGLVAGIGSFWLLGYAVVKIGGSLVQQSQPMAFALSAWFLGIKFRNRFQRVFGKASKTSDDPDELDAAEATNGSDARSTSKSTGSVERSAQELAADPPNKVDSSEGSRSGHQGESRGLTARRNEKDRWRAVKRVAWFGVIGGAAVVAVLCLRPQLRIKGPFDILPVRNADVRAEVEGIIDQIYVEEGQTVQKGDLIARLMDRDLQAELHKTEAAIQEAQAKLKLLVAGPRAEEIEQARIELAKDAEAVTFAASKVARFKTLYEEKLLSKQELEDNEALLALGKAVQAESKSKLELLLAGSRPEEIEAMKASCASLETQRLYLQEQIRLMRVLSPASGIVATPARQLMEMKNQLVKKGDLIAKVYDLKMITAEMVISERDIADVRVGQKVVLKARAYPEMTFHGKVTTIATVAQVSSSSSTASAVAQVQGGTQPGTLTRSAVAPKTVTITTEIDNTSLLLKPEMTGQAKIFCGERRLLDLVIRRLARTAKVEFWSWW